jgi:hypothetical protein
MAAVAYLLALTWIHYVMPKGAAREAPTD